MEDLILPESLRSYLRKPLGKLYSGEDALKKIKEEVGDARVIAVGDIVSKKAEEVGIDLKVKIIDYRTRREEMEKYQVEGKVFKAKNPPGHITKELWDAVHEAVNYPEKAVVVVEGEEDLAVIPAVIEADWGDYVIYGQPDEGVVLVSCDDDSKFHVGTIVKMIMDSDELKLRR